MINTVYISVGTNIGNKVSNCRLAIKKIMSISNSCKISSFYKDNVLNEQTFCNPEFYEGQVGTMIEELSGKLGEKIYIKKFSRIEVGT